MNPTPPVAAWSSGTAYTSGDVVSYDGGPC
jgi:chitodextrinase